MNDHASRPPARHQLPAASPLWDTFFSSVRVPRARPSCRESSQRRSAAFARASSPPFSLPPNEHATARRVAPRPPSSGNAVATVHHLNPQLRLCQPAREVSPTIQGLHPSRRVDFQRQQNASELSAL